MDFMTFIIVVVLVLILAVGLIGLYLILRGGRNKRVSRKTGAAPEGLVVVARLVRDKATGMFLIGMEGNVYAKVAELSADQRQRLEEAAHDLEKWLGRVGEAPAPMAVPAPPVAVDRPPAAASVAEPVVEPVVRPVSTNPLVALRHSMGSSKPAPAFLSITSQINTILQGMLTGTPLEHRGISLTESPNVGVVVRVGLEQYPGIDAVPEEEIRALIRAAVAEWERQNR